MKNCFYAFILLFLFFFILFLKNEKRVPFNIIFSTKEDVEELNNPAGNPLITSIFLLQLANMKNQYFIHEFRSFSSLEIENNVVLDHWTGS